MSRLDHILKQHPEHDEGIRLLATRDPSGKLKYLDWGAKMLASKQALAPEIADVLDLFHRFAGQRLPGVRRLRTRATDSERIRADIHTYRPQDLTHLRDNLFALRRATDRKRRKREKLYRIDGTIEADIIYEEADLIVRHIKNKNASIHYGHDTKWCIAMKREGYFEDYESANATFFFFERRPPLRDEFDKVAIMMSRNNNSSAEAYTTLDQRVDVMALVKAYGPRVFNIFPLIYARSEAHPPSIAYAIRSGSATSTQLEDAFNNLRKLDAYEARVMLTTICCNDEAPPTLLDEIYRRGPALVDARFKQQKKSRRRRDGLAEITRVVLCALAIHPNTRADTRAEVISALRRRRIPIASIYRSTQHHEVRIEYTMRGRSSGVRRRPRRQRLRATPTQLRAIAAGYERRARRTREKAEKLEAAAATKKLRAKPGATNAKTEIR